MMKMTMKMMKSEYNIHCSSHLLTRDSAEKDDQPAVKTKVVSGSETQAEIVAEADKAEAEA